MLLVKYVKLEDVKLTYLLDHQVPLDGVEITAEVHKEYPDEGAW